MQQESIWNQEYLQNKSKWNRETQLPIILKDKSVLELGVGNGKTLRAILRQKPHSVTAIDFSSEAIKKSESMFDKKITFLKANVKELPFEDCSFDIIVCYYTLNNLLRNERAKAVSEICRVLKNKGLVLFEDFAIGDFRETGKIIERHTIENKKGLICHFFTLKELKDLFRSFSQINLTKKVSTPITRKPLIRNIISGTLIK